MHFGYVNGFQRDGRLVAREVAISSIDHPDLVSGCVVNLSGTVFSHFDDGVNLRLTEFCHGLEYPPHRVWENEIFPNRLAEYLTCLFRAMGGHILYVNSFEQKQFFEEMGFLDVIHEPGLPTYASIKHKDVEIPVHPGYHRSGMYNRCASAIARHYARHLQDERFHGYDYRSNKDEECYDREFVKTREEEYWDDEIVK